MAMKTLVKLIKSSLYDFIEGQPHHSHHMVKQKPISLQTNKNLALIKQALQINSPVHLICSEKDITGLIIKYNKEKGQVMINNNNVTQIVTISDIKKLSLLPKVKE